MKNIHRTIRATHYIYGIGILAVIIGLGAAGWYIYQRPDKSSQIAQPSLIDASTIKKLATTSVPIDRTHLEDSLTPPTNKWFSGFALQAVPEPGYNYPNSFRPTDSGFELSLPKVHADSKLITGTHSPDLVVTLENATSYKITYYDELVVALTYYDKDGQAIATIHLASGLPYVSVSAEQSTSITFTGSASSEDSQTHIRSNATQYGINIASNNNQFTLARGKHVSFFSSPNEKSFDTVAAHAGAIVQSGKVTYARQGAQFKTTFSYTTLNDQSVLFARQPHQQATNSSSAVTYRSILGDMKTDVGSSFSFDTPAVPVTPSLNLSGISGSNKKVLLQQLRRDITTFEEKTDTYFGGKQLYRMAQLLQIAEQLGEKDAAATAKKTLRTQLDAWLTPGKNEPKSFLYEPSMHGIVGNEASFGSDKEFNDHHFHYGYFIYASAILAQYDKQFEAAHKKTIDLLVADIANYNSGEKLPLRRSFDAYAGHSWASGTVPFADGNNQESTSEAINAWIGVSLWARQTGNTGLELEGDWMLSQESYTAQLYWLRQHEKNPGYLKEFTSPIASLVWGGKREYATFFSDEANAKLAIQLLPLSPSTKPLVASLPKNLFAGTSANQIFGDYILMAQPGTTIDQAIGLPDTFIDDGNSRTYLYAYLLAK